ncbi:MAG: sensor signal transduction histidine kinase [Thermoleophilia bacterium]|nr:sensor signal transduction histidine kinase [Thermoleophilia bacterium]
MKEQFLDHVRLLAAPLAAADDVRPNARDDSPIARALVMFGFPILTLLGWWVVEPGARTEYLAAVAWVIVMNTIGWVAPITSWPRWAEMSLPTSVIVALWVMAAATGGVAGGFAVMIFSPILWFAMFADPRDMVMAVAVLGACLVLPAQRIFDGFPDQGNGIQRAAFLMTALTLMAGARPLVVRLRRNEALARRATTALETSHTALAHDLRTPLTAICGLATLSQQRLRDPSSDDVAAAVEYAGKIGELGWRAASIIDGVMELSRAGEQLPSVERVDVAGVLSQLEAEIPTVIVVRDEVPGEIVAHRPSIERLFRNLLENAARHGVRDTLNPAVRVTVTGGSVSRGWRFSIVDDGPGFRVDEVDGLFRRWSRGSDAQGSGHGLGLAIAAAIVEQHGGSIHASNDPAGGARIDFSLTDAPNVSSTPAASRSASPPIAVAHGG